MGAAVAFAVESDGDVAAPAAALNPDPASPPGLPGGGGRSPPAGKIAGAGVGETAEEGAELDVGEGAA